MYKKTKLCKPMFSVGHLELIIIISINFIVGTPFNISIDCFYFQNNSLPKEPLKYDVRVLRFANNFCLSLYSPSQTAKVETDSTKTF